MRGSDARRAFEPQYHWCFRCGMQTSEISTHIHEEAVHSRDGMGCISETYTPIRTFVEAKVHGIGMDASVRDTLQLSRSLGFGRFGVKSKRAGIPMRIHPGLVLAGLEASVCMRGAHELSRLRILARLACDACMTHDQAQLWRKNFGRFGVGGNYRDAPELSRLKDSAGFFVGGICEI